MKYLYTVVYSIAGVSLPDGKEHSLIEDADSGLKAVLTLDATPYLAHADYSNGIASLIIDCMLRGATWPGDLDEALATLAEEARQARGEQFGQGPFLVITVGGEGPVGKPQCVLETGQFVVWRGGGNKRAIRVEHQSRVTAILTSVILYDDKIGRIRLVGDSVIYFRKDGMPIYALTPEMRARAHVSSPILDDAATSIQEFYSRALKNQGLTSVQRLLRTSFEIEDDRFQAFLSAWLALEILVQKVFAEYGWTDNYSVGGKFRAIALELDPDHAVEDLKAFGEIKKHRNEIVHHDTTVTDSRLPLEQARAIARKYLLLHMKRAGPSHLDTRTG